MFFPIAYSQQPTFYSQRPSTFYSPYAQRPSYAESVYNEPLTYKFNEVDEKNDEMIIGKQASTYLYNEFMEQYLQEVALERKNSMRFNQAYGHPLFDSFFAADPYQSITDYITKDDIKKANEAFSKHIFKNYKFSISRNNRELAVVNGNNKLVKIFELPNSYENISIESLTTLETGLAIIKLTLKKNNVAETPVKKIQKKQAKSENKSRTRKVRVKQRKEEEEQLKQEKKLAEEAAAQKAKAEKELKQKQKEEQKKLKAKQLEQAKKEYESKQRKLKEQKERMEKQAEKLKQREQELQELYAKELRKLELEAQLESQQTVHSPVVNDDNESDEDVHMNEESLCSDESDSLDSKVSNTSLPLKKKTSITVEDIEDESDKEYRISLMKFPNSNAVLEGI
ncbi:hypothetical protein ACO0OL_000061 [Hanseniaspora opuntiae]